MKYIDFDDVILNTSEILIDAYNKKYNTSVSYICDDNFFINYDYNKLLVESSQINNSINVIKSFDPNEVTILTKILSLDNEGMAKINYLRKNGVKCNIVLVPEHVKKCDVVNASGNILVDDLISNLVDWENAGGKGIFFDRYNNRVDARGDVNTRFESTDTLEILNKY